MYIEDKCLIDLVSMKTCNFTQSKGGFVNVLVMRISAYIYFEKLSAILWSEKLQSVEPIWYQKFDIRQVHAEIYYIYFCSMANGIVFHM